MQHLGQMIRNALLLSPGLFLSPVASASASAWHRQHVLPFSDSIFQPLNNLRFCSEQEVTKVISSQLALSAIVRVTGCYIVLGLALLHALVCSSLPVGGDWAWSCHYWGRPTSLKAVPFPRWMLALASHRQTLAHTLL